MKIRDWTQEALNIRNNYEYGDYLNSEIVGEWGDDECIRYIKDYLEFIWGINGVNEMYDWELELAKELKMEL